ncbi:MAG: hypothetical protein AAF415_10810 [Pseudomonadota bacterium]
MNKVIGSVIVLLGCAALVGCGGRSAPAADPAVAAASKAKSDAIMQTATEIDIDGQIFLVGHSPDKTYALVGHEAGAALSGRSLEQAASRTTGCDAVFEGGVLQFVPNITKDTNLPFKEKGRLRVETYCEGDTRKRLTGLREGRPGSDKQAAKYPTYPLVGRTYLSFSQQHGFQVSYYSSSEESWLWYPKNSRAVPELWRIEGQDICYKHPSGTYNPVTKARGGSFECNPMDLVRRTLVADLEGDTFDLSKGTVPYRRAKCDAPDEFTFDRNAIGC